MVTVCLTVDRGDGTEEFVVGLYIHSLTTQGLIMYYYTCALLSDLCTTSRSL